MIATMLLDVPLGMLILSYFCIGLMWALMYGHYRLCVNVKRYTKWREPRADLLSETNKDWEKFFEQRDHMLRNNAFFDFTRFLYRLTYYFSAWPLSMMVAVLCEVLIPVIRRVWNVLSKLHVYIRKALNAMYRMMSRTFGNIIARENREAINDMAELNKVKEV